MVSEEKDNKSIKGDKMELNNKELQFYEELETQLQKAGVFYNITYNFLSDGTIDFSLDSLGQIGRIKIRGRKTKMQIIHPAKNGNIDVLWIENAPLDDMIERLYEWVNYAKYLEQQKHSDYTEVVNMDNSKKKKSKAPIIVAAVVGLGIIGSAGNDSDDSKNTNHREERETTSITTTITETEETEWNIWEDEETTAVETEAETEITTETAIETTTTTVETTTAPETTTETTTTTADTSPTVYITPTGSKYHYDNTCNGGTYKESTLNQAERMGLEPCNKCVLG